MFSQNYALMFRLWELAFKQKKRIFNCERKKKKKQEIAKNIE